MKRNLLIGLFLMLYGVSSMTATVSAIAYAVERSTSDGKILPSGTVVVADGADAVRPARSHEGQYVFGAVAAVAKDSLSAGRVGVVSSGVVSALVSDINGTIKSGDRVAISSIEGVGMKATTSGWMIGIAQRDFATIPREAVKEQVVTGEGKKITVSIKEIPVLLSVSYYNPDTDANAKGIGGSVQNTLEGVAGHSVPADRALLALLIFGIAMILLVTLIYSAVKTSIVSIGRNPLAHVKIIGSLIKVLATSVGVIIITLGIIYLILQ
jgi:hypothetical protein